VSRAAADAVGEATFVIFSMFLTDFKRSSISRRVAMFRALGGPAPSAGGCSTVRARDLRASIIFGRALTVAQFSQLSGDRNSIESGSGIKSTTSTTFASSANDNNHHDDDDMAEQPLFDPSLKKRKKKQVVFSEDPLGRDADPTAPAPETIDNHTLNGDAVDLGTKTVHEQTKQSRIPFGDGGGDRARDQKEDDEFKAMFGDLKKKKKKKEIPIDLVRSPPFYLSAFPDALDRETKARAHRHPHPRPLLPPPPRHPQPPQPPPRPRKTSTFQTSKRRKSQPRRRPSTISRRSRKSSTCRASGTRSQ